jgi:hypothetical protein
MKSFTRWIALGAMAAALLLPPALAQVSPGGGAGGKVVQGGGINNAPQPAVYAVISIEAESRMVQLRAPDGRTGAVQVGESVFDLSKLKAGDKIKVDFVESDEKNPQLRAAAIWPVL